MVVDLDATETIDSRGLTALLNWQDNLRELGGDLKIATTNPNNRKILEMTRLDQQPGSVRERGRRSQELSIRC